MKTLPIVLAGTLALSPYTVTPQEVPEPKMTSFLEGLCIGLIVGIGADAAIVIGIKCYKHAHPPRNEPPPLPGAPLTNCPPPMITNSSMTVLQSGDDGVVWYTNGAFSTVLESSETARTWTEAYTITGWPVENGNWRILVQDNNGTPLLTNQGPWLQALPLTISSNSPTKFLRLRAP